MARPHVILSAGHRNNDPRSTGADGERPLTGRYADAYAERLILEGFKVHYIQRLDDANDRDPGWFSGDLTKVASTVVSVARSLPENVPIVMLDVHMEAPSSAGGVFAIIPDGAGLKLSPITSRDTWENNERSLRLARLISRGISESTGIPLRRAREPGVMSEKQTGVAIELKSRLAMFRQTAPLQDQMERLVIEHGNLRMDAARLHNRDTPPKVAGAVAVALRNFYGGPPPRRTPQPSTPVVPAPASRTPPAGRFAPRISPPPLDGRDHVVNGVEFVASRRLVTIARDGVPALRFAEPGATPVRAPFRRGEMVEVAFFVRSTPFDGDPRWWVAVDGSRIPMAGTVEKLRKD